MIIMNRKLLYGLFALSLLTAGCGDQEDISLPSFNGQRIAVSANVMAVGATTRSVVAVPYEQTTPSASKLLDASVWFSTTSGNYANTGTPGSEATLPLHSRVQFNSGGAVYPYSDVLRYPGSGTVYAVGLYPYSGYNASVWTSTDASDAADNTKASHVINGVDDLMFASEQSAGDKDDPVTAPLAFNHLLTWLKIKISAESGNAVDAWGDLTNITIQNPNSKLTVSLNTGAVEYHGSSADVDAFTGTQSLEIPDYQIASIFCAPAKAYNITVTTTNGGTKNLGAVALKDTDGNPLTDENYMAKAKGNMFVITLNFSDVSIINATCGSLNPWEDQANIDLKP